MVEIIERSVEEYKHLEEKRESRESLEEKSNDGVVDRTERKCQTSLTQGPRVSGAWR